MNLTSNTLLGHSLLFYFSQSTSHGVVVQLSGIVRELSNFQLFFMSSLFIVYICLTISPLHVLCMFLGVEFITQLHLIEIDHPSCMISLCCVFLSIHWSTHLFLMGCLCLTNVKKLKKCEQV